MLVLAEIFSTRNRELEMSNLEDNNRNKANIKNNKNPHKWGELSQQAPSERAK